MSHQPCHVTCGRVIPYHAMSLSCHVMSCPVCFVSSRRFLLVPVLPVLLLLPRPLVVMVYPPILTQAVSACRGLLPHLDPPLELPLARHSVISLFRPLEHHHQAPPSSLPTCQPTYHLVRWRALLHLPLPLLLLP